jgi:competence protein ComEC
VTGLPVNRRAVVLQVEAGDDRLLLTADSDSAAEALWLPRAGAPVTVLNLGHHGAGSSTGGALLDALRPRRAVVSCGRENRFGHPHPATLARLRARRIPLWRTDLEGTARIELGEAVGRGRPRH